ncbi:MAG: hypothetical protein RLZZ241_607 [Bacteroidota bacterium]|jgi:hypothetical protein
MNCRIIKDKAIAYALGLGTFISVQSQSNLVNWTEKTSDFLDTSNCFKYYESTGDLKLDDGSFQKFKGYFVIADLNDTACIIKTHFSRIPQGYSNFFSTNQSAPVMIVNGGFFGADTSYSLLIANDTIHSKNPETLIRNGIKHLVSRPAFYLDMNNNPGISWVYTDNKEQTFRLDSPIDCTEEEHQESQHLNFMNTQEPLKPKWAIGGGPMLIYNNTILETYTPEHFLEDITDAIAPRTAVGITADNKVVFMVIDGRQEHSVGVSLQSLAKLMSELGCSYAMNLDGGSSSFMALNKVIINKPSGLNPPRISTIISLGLR